MIFVILICHYSTRLIIANRAFMIAGIAHSICCILVVKASQLLVKRINPTLATDYDINLSTEGRRQNFSIGSILYLSLVCLALYIMTIGNGFLDWFCFYSYTSVLVYRVITFLQAVASPKVKVFPYMNRHSSSLMVFFTLVCLEYTSIKLPHLLFCIFIV